MPDMTTYIIDETSINPATGKAYEGAFTQGAGSLHIRASYEEGLVAAPQNEEYMRLPANVTIEKPKHPRSKCGTYLAGITGNHPLLREELVNLPNPLHIKCSLAGEEYDADISCTTNYLRRLDMRTGVLCRSFNWHTKQGAVIQCEYTRFVARGEQNCIVQHVKYHMLEGQGTLSIRSTIGEKVKTNGYNHFTHVHKNAQGGCIELELATDNGDIVRMVSGHKADSLFMPDGEGNCITHKDMQAGDMLDIWKITILSGTNEGTEPHNFIKLNSMLESAFVKTGPALQQQNCQLWEQLWNSCEIRIEGDATAQQAINFSMYHLLRCSHTNNRVAVCAKGFSGEAYFGHFFWDTEMYLLPFYMHTQPDVARTLLDFRIRTLAGAQENARVYGYSGAKYPWESSVSGTEQCPNWQYADHEIHISADVVFGLWSYWLATKDTDFLRAAVPVFLETSHFWLERVYQTNGEYHINGVMGPDEYVCLCNNNAYTNYMVRYALKCTLEAIQIVGRSHLQNSGGVKITDELLLQIETVADGLTINGIGEQGIIPQCDNFTALEEPYFDKTWPDRTKPYGQFVSQERNYRTKALKQADVLMLPYLFPEEFSTKCIAQNMEYYLPYTTHDSSLSAIIHSILFCRLKDTQRADEFFKRALNIDLDFIKGGAAEGVHIANCGGIWQAIVYGFGGMHKLAPGKDLQFTPCLPAGWHSLSFRIVKDGRLYQVEINHNQEQPVCRRID